MACLLGGAAVLGLAHVALLPPWEGFDEAQHYSSLQQIAELHELPALRTARASRVIEDYGASAPTHYDNATQRDLSVSSITYRSFFQEPATAIARGRALVHGPPSEPRRYVAGRWRNWEAQHPPLYYLVLAPVYLLTRDLSWGAQLLLLRSLSYLLAWLALPLGVYTCAQVLPVGGTLDRRWLTLGVAAWPVLFPGWFPEMARLGSDSLCALLAALISWATLRALRDGPSLRHAAVLGVLLGLGWLTKAFFVPFTVGLLAFWCVRQWRRGGISALLALWPHVLVAGGLIAAIAGWWYVDNWRVHGVVSGSIDVVRVEERGGLVSGLRERFTPQALVRFLASFVVRFAWPSTWSLARPSYMFLVPLGLLVLGAVAAYLVALRRFRVTEPEWLPVWVTAPILAGFGHHMLVWIALTGKGAGFGGYYLHFLVAPLGPALGLAIAACWSRATTRILAGALSVYSIVFAVAITWAQVLLFAGILARSSLRFYEVPSPLPPLLGVPEALSRLTALAFPVTGAVAWIVGGGLVLAGVLAARRAAAALPPLR